jgi:protein SCO1/2
MHDVDKPSRTGPQQPGRRHRRTHRWAAVLVLAGCGGPNEAPQRLAPAEPRVQHRAYPLRGEVVRVDRKNGSASIRHEAIPGYMPEMTMPFDVSDRAVLADLEVGDEVEGRLLVETGRRSRLTELAITRPAVSPPAADPAAPPQTLEVGQEVPDFRVTTQDGEILRIADFRGKALALTWIYTRCPLPDYCPLMDRRFREAAERLRPRPERAAGVRLLSVSFDPAHDVPEVLRRHARLRGASPPLWRFAVAGEEDLARAGPAHGLL